MLETSLKQRFQTPAQCLNWLLLAVLLFIFPLPRKKWRRWWGGLFISKGIGTHRSKENTKKREKRILCESSEGFQNFSFLPIINMIFPFALSSPLWHSWYISLSIINKLQSSPTMSFCCPSRLQSDGRGCFYFLEFGGLQIKECRGTACNIY